jgi:hypothetical protein
MKQKASIDKAIEMAHDLNSRIIKAPGKRLKVIEQFYLEKSSTGDSDEAHLALLYKSLAGEVAEMGVPEWFAKAGYLSGGVTLLFFMALVVASIFGYQVPHDSRFLVGLVVALGGSLAVTFLGGEMAASGKIPLAAQHPLKFSATGGVATLVVLLALMHYFYG